MSLDRTLWREAIAHYRAWNEAKFVEQVLTAGQKTPVEKWREYQEACAKTAEALSKGVEDRTLVWGALSILGGIARRRGEVGRAQELAEEALEIARSSGNESGINSVYCDLGDLTLQQGNYVEAERLYREALRGFEKEGNQERIASRHIDLGNVTFLQGRLDEARKHYQVGLTLSQSIGRQDNIAYAQYGLARVDERAVAFPSALELAPHFPQLASASLGWILHSSAIQVYCVAWANIHISN